MMYSVIRCIPFADISRRANTVENNVFMSKNFRLAFLGSLISDLAGVLYSFAISFYILEISDNNAFLQGLYLALCSVALLLTTPVGGVLGDRYNKAKIMFICDLIPGGIVLLSALCMLSFPGYRSQLLILFIVGILGNAILGISMPVSASLLPDLVEDGQLQQANAYYSAKSSLLSIIGIVLAGILYGTFPIIAIVLIVGICYTLSGISEMFINYTHTASDEKMTVSLFIADTKEGFSYLRSQKPIMALMAASLFINFFINPVESNFIPFFIKTDLKSETDYLFSRTITPELWSSVFNVLLAVSTLIGSLIISTKDQENKCGHKTALRLCAVAGTMIAATLVYWSFTLSYISLNAMLLVFCAVHVAIGVLIAYLNIPTSTVMMRKVETEKLSKVSSLITILSMGLTPFGSIMAGFVLQVFGSTPLLTVCSLGCLITALLLLFNKHVKEL